MKVTTTPESLAAAFALGILVATPAGRTVLLSLAASSTQNAKPAPAEEAKQGKNNLFSRVWAAIVDEGHD